MGRKVENVNSAKKRIREFFYSKGLDLKTAESRCGYARGFLSAGGVVGSDKLEKLVAAYPEIDLNWVVTGVVREDNIKMPESNTYKDAYHAAMLQISALNRLVEELEDKVVE